MQALWWREREVGDLYPSDRVRGERAAAPHLVLLQTALVDHLVALLLERDDDQRHEDVDEKEGEDHEIHHVEDGHLHPVPSTRAHVLLCDVGGMLQDPGRRQESGQNELRRSAADDRGRRSLRPPLSRGDGEEGEESPADVVIVKLVSPPLPPLHLLLVSGVVNVEASEGHKSRIAEDRNFLSLILLLFICVLYLPGPG